MEWIRNYLLSIICAAVLCGIVTSLLGKKGTPAAVGKLLCGVFLSFTILKPWASVQLEAVGEYLTAFSQDAQWAVENGENFAADSATELIKQKCQAYILDKAAAMNASVQAQVILDPEPPYAPRSVILTGDASPYVRQQLQQMITQDLAIPKEAQTWSD